MKKILTNLLLISFSFNLIAVNNTAAFYQNENYNNLSIETKKEIQKIKNWDSYLKSIDNFIEKNKDNQKLLLKLSEKTDNLLYNDELNNTNVINIISYLNYKSNIELQNIEDAINSEIFSNTISNDEKKIASDRINKLQLNIFNSSKNLIDKLTSQFNNMSRYSEKWDLSIKFDLNNKNYWSIKSNFELTNYDSSAYNFESQLKWEFNALIEALPKWENEVKLQIKSLVDLISKDWNIYFLLKDFNILNEKWVDNIKTYLDKIKEISKENKYIKYEDQSNKFTFAMLQNLNPANIERDLKWVLEKPLFEAYQKKWDKYYIKPTKYACDKLKEISNKFDPFNGINCSDSQYKNELTRLSKLWQIYLIIDWDNSTLWFEWRTSKELEKNNWYITFNDKEIIEINYEITPNQNLYKDEFLKFNFVNRKGVNFDLYANKWDINFKFNWKLNDQNKFTNYDLNWKNNSLNIVSQLSNNKITWTFNYKVKWYDYETWEYIDKSNITWTISWKTNFQNNLENLDITYKSTDIAKNIVKFNWKFTINNSNFSFQNHYIWEYNKSNIVLDWKIDTNKQINDLNLKIDSQRRSGKYDYDTWEYTYEDTFSKNFNIDLVIINKNLNWKIFIFNWDQTIFELNTRWDYSLDKFDIQNNFRINDEYINSYLWEKLNWNLNAKWDFSGDLNNFYMFFDLLSNSWKIINLEINNTWKKYKWSNEIKTPTNTIDYKDAFWIPDYNDEYYDYDNYYDDDYYDDYDDEYYDEYYDEYNY